ncbi:substrate-binding domain-containing protein, partial [Arthrobacter deserti]|nr:substrate-binding domain-containing protein [Arthrobacter deserti]
RIRGLQRGFAGSGIRFEAGDSVATSNNAQGGAAGVARTLDHGIWPDCLIAYSDAAALGVYAELRRRNLEPGRDVPVASFDDISIAEMLLPPLTSVATYPRLIGRQAAQRLLDRIGNPAIQAGRALIEPALKVRASTALWRPRT